MQIITEINTENKFYENLKSLIDDMFDYNIYTLDKINEIDDSLAILWESGLKEDALNLYGSYVIIVDEAINKIESEQVAYQ